MSDTEVSAAESFNALCRAVEQAPTDIDLRKVIDANKQLQQPDALACIQTMLAPFINHKNAFSYFHDRIDRAPAFALDNASIGSAIYHLKLNDLGVPVFPSSGISIAFRYQIIARASFVERLNTSDYLGYIKQSGIKVADLTDLAVYRAVSVLGDLNLTSIHVSGKNIINGSINGAVMCVMLTYPPGTGEYCFRFIITGLKECIVVRRNTLEIFFDKLQYSKETLHMELENTVAAALKTLHYIDQPCHYLVEETPKHVGERKLGKKIARFNDRERWLVMDPQKAKHSHAERSDKPVVGTHTSPAIHLRRAHKRVLKSERFTFKKGSIINIRPTWIGDREWTGAKGARYKVVSRLGANDTQA